MKYLAAVAMLIGILAVPALGQHGVARGGFGGHVGGAAPHAFSSPAPRSFSRGFSGGFASHGPVGLRPGGFGTRGPVALRPGGFGARGPVAFRPGSPRLGQRPGMMRFAGSRFAGSRGPMNTPYRRFGAGADHGRSPHDRDRDHDHDRHHRMVYWNGGIYPYWYFYSGYPIYAGTINPWLFGPDEYDQDSSGAGYADSGSGYGSGGNYGEDSSGYPDSQYAPDPGYAGQYGTQEPGSPQYAPQGQPNSARPPYRQPYTGASPANGSSGGTGQGSTAGQGAGQGSSAGLGSPTVTVIFNDGRPEAHIHDYLLTADTLTVFEPQYRQIPLDQVNLAATQAANQAAGVEFRVPRR